MVALKVKLREQTLQCNDVERTIINDKYLSVSTYLILVSQPVLF